MLAGFLIKVMGTLMDLGLPWVLAYIIDDVIPLGKVSNILYWGLGMLFLSFGARIGNIIANRMAARVAGDAVKHIRNDLFEKIQQLSGAQVDFFSIPSLVSRMTSDTYNVHQMIGMMQRMGVRAPIIIIGGILITATLDPVLTLILAGTLPLLGMVVYIVTKKGIPLYSAGQEATDRMVRTVRENISGIRVIKALSKTDYEKDRFAENNKAVVARELKAGITMAVIKPAMNLLLNLGLTLVVIVGAYRVNDGVSETGKIVAFLSYFTMILNAVLGITKVFTILSKAGASSKRISEVLNEEEDLKIEDITNSDEKSNIDYHIAFDNVSFTYNKREKSGVKLDDDLASIINISFVLKKGEALGIIGSTGAGKTTLVNLLMRYYDVEKGAIFINGRNIKTYPLQELRSRFGVVFQNDSIFADTVKENIDLSRGLTIEQIEDGAKDAQAYDFIMQLGFGDGEDTGYEYPIATKGLNLSGGQKQRLLISRALAGNPEILILDDSSSALDYRTDSNLRKAMREHFKETTKIVIAQRISSIMNMDHILVLDEGQLIGYGNHEELLQTCGIYEEIYQSQMGDES
jgi:ATP-binding cassette subfamily B protein